MTTLTIADLFPDKDYLRQLTKEEEVNIFGGATGAGSVSAAQYSERGDVIQEEAVTATVAVSDRRPFEIDLTYSFEPLVAAAGVSFI